MIDSEAWGPNGDVSSDDCSTNSNISVHDEQHDDLDVGHDNDGHHLLSGEVGGERGRGGGGGWSAHASTPTSLSTSTTNTKTRTATTKTTTTTAITTVRTLTTSMATTPTTSITSTTMDADSSMDEDQHGCYEDDDDDEEEDDDEGEDEEGDDETEQSKAAVEGEEEKLPRLTLHFADPVGSRFDELLYWVSMGFSMYRNNNALSWVCGGKRATLKDRREGGRSGRWKKERCMEKRWFQLIQLRANAL